MHLKQALVAVVIMILATTGLSFAAVTVEAVGESTIVGDDMASARLQAIARAKWAAMEQAAGVEVNSETVIQNAVLVDEAIASSVKGVITDVEVLGEEEDGSTYRVLVKATIEPKKAEEAIGALARNTSITVFLPVVFPDGHVEESTSLSEKVINELAMENFQVIDLAGKDQKTAAGLTRAIEQSDFTAARGLAYENLASMMLIGKVNANVTARPGTNTGYGVTLPFTVVNGVMTYRLVSIKEGRGTVIASGSLNGRGMAPDEVGATYRMLENLAQNVSSQLIGTVMNAVARDGERTIRVILAGNNDVDDLLELKQTIQYISWVLGVTEDGIDALIVRYPEKTLYLATAIDSKLGYRVEKVEEFTIRVRGR